MRLTRRSLFVALSAPLLPLKKLAEAAPIPGTYGALTRSMEHLPSSFSNTHTSALDVELMREWVQKMQDSPGVAHGVR